MVIRPAIRLEALAAVYFFAPETMEDVAVVRVEGEILTGDFSNGAYVGSEYVGRTIREAAENPLITAIVLRIDSPGGSPAAAQEIVRDLEYARERKPVVASMGDLAASAAYLIAAHTDRIYLSPDTMTGSIGVVWLFTDESRWMKNECTEEGGEHRGADGHDSPILYPYRVGVDTGGAFHLNLNYD